MRLLIFHTGSLGDTLVAVPSLWAIRGNFPDAQIDLLSNRSTGDKFVQAKEILDDSGLINNYLSYSNSDYRSILKVLIKIWVKPYDKLVYLIRARNSLKRIKRDIRVFRWVGVRTFIGTEGIYHYQPRFQGQPRPQSPRVAKQLLNRLEISGLCVPALNEARWDIGIGQREREKLNQFILSLPSDGGRRWVALGISSKMPCKIWPFKRYQEVLEKLIRDYNIWPVFFGGQEDNINAVKMAGNLGRGYVFAGKLNIREAAAAMERCWFYLGNDSGVMHLAASANLRCVALFSAREVAGAWFPYGPGHQILRSNVSCEGCMLDICNEEKMKCLLSISTQQVSAACRKVITRDYL